MKSNVKRILFFIVVVHISGCQEADSPFLPGYVHGDFIYISSPASEKVEALLVKKGDVVEQGQNLVKLESFNSQNALQIAEKNFQAENALLENLKSGERPDELNIVRAQLERAQSAARLAKSQLARYQKLYVTNAISALELEIKREDYAQKNAQIKELSRQLKVKQMPSRTSQIDNQAARVASAKLQWDKALWDNQQSTLAAPMKARVYDILYREGERVAAGQPVISLLPAENVKVRIYLPEKILGSLQPGKKVRIWLDGREKPLAGNINYISPQAEYSPPVIYSTQRREKLIFMAEVVPEKEQAQFVNVGQPARVEIVANE